MSAIALWYVIRVKRGQQKTSNPDSQKLVHDEDSHIPLPPHIERIIHKEKRRKQMMSKLTMKRTMYDNIFMYSPDGEVLATISKKKADWYIHKELAEWEDSNRENAIRLLFHPKRPQRVDPERDSSEYNCAVKANQCVVCGSDQHFMRHYVVPYAYRSRFPESFKTHMPHDVVLVCGLCNARVDAESQKLMSELEDNLRKDPATAKPNFRDERLCKVKSWGRALLKHQDRLPDDKVALYREFLKAYYGLSEPGPIPVEYLQKAVSIDPNIKNPNYVSGSDLIIQSLKDSDQITEFIKLWRRHFVDTHQPRFLPTGWAIDSPVQSHRALSK